MNQPKAHRLLVELGDAASTLNEVCAREGMRQFAPFWASVAEVATSLSSAPSRDGVHRLVRDVLSEYRQVPGGFMDMYIVRANAADQLRANDMFDTIRTTVRIVAEQLYAAIGENQVEPLNIRRALTELEGELLAKGAADAAGRVRALLNGAELQVEAVASLCTEFEAHPPVNGTTSCATLGRLRAALLPSTSATWPSS